MMNTNQQELTIQNQKATISGSTLELLKGIRRTGTSIDHLVDLAILQNRTSVEIPEWMIAPALAGLVLPQGKFEPLRVVENDNKLEEPKTTESEPPKKLPALADLSSNAGSISAMMKTALLALGKEATDQEIREQYLKHSNEIESLYCRILKFHQNSRLGLKGGANSVTTIAGVILAAIIRYTPQNAAISYARCFYENASQMRNTIDAIREVKNTPNIQRIVKAIHIRSMTAFLQGSEAPQRALTQAVNKVQLTNELPHLKVPRDKKA